MTKKTTITLPLIALALLVLLGGAIYYGHRSSSALPATSTNTPAVVVKPTVLLGTIQAIQGSAITISLQQGGTAKVTVSSSTIITKNVLKDAKTLAVEFKEYQALKAKAGGKPVALPIPATTVHLSLGDLKAGLSVLVTPQTYSTTNATAVSIVVLLSPVGATASSTSAN